MFLLPQIGVYEEHLSLVNFPVALWEKRPCCTALFTANILASDGGLVIPKDTDLLDLAARIIAGAAHVPPNTLLSKVKTRQRYQVNKKNVFIEYTLPVIRSVPAAATPTGSVFLGVLDP